jgi:hypothetical protein
MSKESPQKAILHKHEMTIATAAKNVEATQAEAPTLGVTIKVIIEMPSSYTGLEMAMCF